MLGQRQGEAQVEVAELAGFFIHREALAAQAQAGAVGGFGLELDFDGAAEGFHGLLAAEQGFVDGYGHVLREVVAGAGVAGIGPQPQRNEQRTVGPAVAAGPALVAQPDGLAVGHARRDGQAQVAAVHRDGARAAVVGLFQAQLQLGLVVGAGSGTTAAAGAPPARVAEQRAEEVGKVFALALAKWAAALALALGVLAPVEAAAGRGAAPRAAARLLLVTLPIGPKLVVLLPLLGVAEHLVGLVDFLEFLLCALVVGVHVGVVLAGQLAVGLLDLLGRGRFFEAQRLVIVFVVHGERVE